MKIQSTLRVAPLRPVVLPSLKRLAGDTHQDVAWSEEGGAAPAPVEEGPPARVETGELLRTARLSALTRTQSPAQQKALRDAYLGLAGTSGALLKDQFPQLGGVADGIEVVVASTQAFRAWSEPQEVNVTKASLSTARAVIAGLEALTPLVPQLQPFAPHLKTLGLIVKVGDSAYALYLAHEAKEG